MKKAREEIERHSAQGSALLIPRARQPASLPLTGSTEEGGNSNHSFLGIYIQLFIHSWAHTFNCSFIPGYIHSTVHSKKYCICRINMCMACNRPGLWQHGRFLYSHFWFLPTGCRSKNKEHFGVGYPSVIFKSNRLLVLIHLGPNSFMERGGCELELQCLLPEPMSAVMCV